jgi:hypothetical protein
MERKSGMGETTYFSQWWIVTNGIASFPRWASSIPCIHSCNIISNTIMFLGRKIVKDEL